MASQELVESHLVPDEFGQDGDRHHCEDELRDVNYVQTTPHVFFSRNVSAVGRISALLYDYDNSMFILKSQVQKGENLALLRACFV